jgi:phosphatidate phosphatase APP1
MNLNSSYTPTDDQSINDRKGARWSNSSSHDSISIKSESSGVFLGELELNDNQVRNWTQGENNNMIKIKAELTNPNGHISSYGTAQLIEPRGISVISDIDDTIKETRVLSGARAVLLSTFFNPTRAIDGMADIYTRWVKYISFFFLQDKM